MSNSEMILILIAVMTLFVTVLDFIVHLIDLFSKRK